MDELPTVPGDRSLLLALFRPLIENAIKYQHPHRDLRVHVTAEPVGQDRWRIVVEDNGIGIDAADADAIFEMFESGASGRSPGQGLGLAAARRIAAAHGGTITAEAAGVGTRIVLELPG